MTGRGQASALTRATAILAALFFVTSLGLTIMASYGRAPRSILDGATAPAGQRAPSAPQGGNVLEQLQRMQGEQPAAPATGIPAPERSGRSRGAAGASVAIRLTIRAGASGPLFLWMAIWMLIWRLRIGSLSFG